MMATITSEVKIEQATINVSSVSVCSLKPDALILVTQVVDLVREAQTGAERLVFGGKDEARAIIASNY
jgi:methylmalonyl-CoA mutase cobalamin-binding subunit